MVTLDPTKLSEAELSRVEAMTPRERRRFWLELAYPGAGSTKVRKPREPRPKAAPLEVEASSLGEEFQSARRRKVALELIGAGVGVDEAWRRARARFPS